MRENNLGESKPRKKARIVGVIAGCTVLALAVEVGLAFAYNAFVSKNMPQPPLTEVTNPEATATVEEALSCVDSDTSKLPINTSDQNSMAKQLGETPSADVNIEFQAIKEWARQNDASLDFSNASRIKSVEGLATTSDGNQNEVSVPVVTSYWQVGSTYLKVVNQMGQHVVSRLTETVEGINDVAQANTGSTEEAYVISIVNPDTNDLVPPVCMASLYDRLGTWSQENETLGLNAQDTYLDEYSIKTKDSATTFDMRGADKNRNVVVIHVAYDAATDTTTFNVG